MFSSIITTNIKLSSKFNYKGFNFGIKIGDFMKKIVCYLLISNLLISQDNVESLKEEALPNEYNVIENVIQDGDTDKENKDIITESIDKIIIRDLKKELKLTNENKK